MNELSRTRSLFLLSGSSDNPTQTAPKAHVVNIICSSQDVFITSTVQCDSHSKKGTCLLSQLRNSEFFKYIYYFAGCRVGPVVEGAKLEGIRIRNGTLELGLGERALKFAWCRLVQAKGKYQKMLSTAN